MPLILLLAFIVVPLVELAVIDEIAGAIGLAATLVLLLADSIVGAVLVKREGARAWTAFRDALEDMRWPGDEVVQGALVLVGGALLLTPGFVTDGVGLAFVLPFTRAGISALIRRRFRQRGPFRTVTFSRPSAGDGGGEGEQSRTRREGPQDGGDATPEVEIISIERETPDGSSDGPNGSTT